MNASIKVDENLRRKSLRERLFPLLWGLLLPIRLYLRLFPVQRGKGIVLRHLLMPILPPQGVEFEMELPGGATISLQLRETLGWSSLLYGTFELKELEFVQKYLRPSDLVLDIGANVGLYSVLMGVAVGGTGRVFAFEPSPANVLRLRKNLQRNHLESAQVFPCALGEQDGQLALHLAQDPAYPSLVEVESGLSSGADITVEVCRLDGVWEKLGRPMVAFAKIDVEGAEMAVIQGASHLLRACKPTLLIEANSVTQLGHIDELLKPLGYASLQPDGFAIHNHIFYHPDSLLDGRRLS
jgi:FkbM family methyltransferase